jgi:hypothetical protein
MFGNQDELTKQIPNQMVINLVGANYLHESITSSLLDITEGEYSGRLRVISLLNLENLIKKELVDDSWGLINLEWMNKTINSRPATLILIYDVRNKPDSVSWKDYESSISLDINKAKKMDNYPFFNVVIILYANSSTFSFDNFIEDKERVYNLKKYVDMKNLIVVGPEGFKNISKKLSSYILKITINYYRNVKKELKVKKNNANDVKENIIGYNIKLGVISQMKGTKRPWKYFEEAYNLLSTLEAKSYYYGGQNLKLNYLEIKDTADWLFYKIFYSKLSDPNTYQSLVNFFTNHVSIFSRKDFFKTDDIVLVFEYYWKYARHDFFARFLEEIKKEEFYLKNLNNFPGYHYLVRNLIKFNFSFLLLI